MAADEIELSNPQCLRRLEEILTLLMYEVGAVGENVRTIQHGRARNVRRVGGQVVFDFELHPERAYLLSRNVLNRAEALGIERFERYRTHWAIKDADLLEELVANVTAEVQPSVAMVAADYIEALRERDVQEQQDLEAELGNFPQSVEKAKSLIPTLALEDPFPEFYPMLDIAPRTHEGRSAVGVKEVKAI